MVHSLVTQSLWRYSSFTQTANVILSLPTPPKSIKHLRHYYHFVVGESGRGKSFLLFYNASTQKPWRFSDCMSHKKPTIKSQSVHCVVCIWRRGSYILQNNKAYLIDKKKRISELKITFYVFVFSASRCFDDSYFVFLLIESE